MLRGIIFDLDGTLVESYLDFDKMRAEMGLPERTPILEALAKLPPEDAAQHWKILDRHEMEGVRRAELMPGVRELLAELARRKVRTAVFTRNSRACTLATLDRFALKFDAVLSRDDAPPKPDPEGILQICSQWDVPPAVVAVIGDYIFDLQAGRAAATRTVLYAQSATREEIAAWSAETDLVLHDFRQPEPLLAWMTESI